MSLLGRARLVIPAAALCASASYGWWRTISPEDNPPTVTRREVAQHSRRDDAWVVIDNKAYDVTSFLDSHPGGDHILYRKAGQDVTAAYHAMGHSQAASQLRSGLYVGDVVESPSTETTDVDVAVIGAGICGCAAALGLAEAGVDVCVVEAKPIVGGTGLRSSAIMWIGPLLEKTDGGSGSLTAWLGHRSFHRLQQMEDEGDDIGFLPRGTIGLVHTEEQKQNAMRIFGKGGRLDGGGEWLNAKQVLAKEPLVNPDAIVGGIYHPKGATVDPWSVCDALRRRSERAGAEFALETTVKDVVSEGDGHTLVCQTSGGKERRIRAKRVLICNGWKARDTAALVGCEVPVEPIHGQMISIETDDESKLNHNVYSWEALTFWHQNRMPHRCTVDADSLERYTRHFYGMQQGNGMFKFGGDRIQGDWNGKVMEDGIQTTFEQLASLFPHIAEHGTVRGSWSGTMPFTPDQRLIMGELKPGIWVLTGSGFMRGIASGECLASMVLKTSIPGFTPSMKRESDPTRFTK